MTYPSSRHVGGSRRSDNGDPAPRLSRWSGSSFPAHAMPAADLARGALELVADGSPAAVALAELVRRIDAGELVERCGSRCSVLVDHGPRCRRR